MKLTLKRKKQILRRNFPPTAKLNPVGNKRTTSPSDLGGQGHYQKPALTQIISFI